MMGIMFFFTQCEKEPVNVGTDAHDTYGFDLKDYTDFPCNGTQELWAGAGQNDTTKGTLVGEVIWAVDEDANELLVKYIIDKEGWSLTEAHLWVGTDIHDIPRNAAPGRFPYKAEVGFVQEYEFTVNLDDLGINPGEEVFVAAHGVVADGVDGLQGLNLPETVNFGVEFFTRLNPPDDPESYFRTTIFEGPLEGIYEGWCVDSKELIETRDKELTGTIYSSYDENLPVLFEFQEEDSELPNNLPLVNWILNYDFVGKESPNGHGPYTLGDVTKAIWILLEEEPNPNPLGGVGPFDDNRIAEIVAKANAEGQGFVPQCGQYVAIIIVVEGQQTTIFKYPVPCGGGTETVWAFGDFAFSEQTPIIARKWGWIFNINCNE